MMFFCGLSEFVWIFGKFAGKTADSIARPILFGFLPIEKRLCVRKAFWKAI